MRESDWKKLPEITEEDKMDELQLHDYFLYGTNMVNQKQTKKLGQDISYYEIIGKDGNKHVEYAPIFDILEKDIIQKGD
jgi:hypothetical protein